jgi:hypothetical protein
MIWVLFLTMYIDAPDSISLDQLGVYRDTNISLFKTERGYLINSSSEGVAVLFNHNGRVLGRYEKRGLGPGEFHRQYVLSVDNNGILFCSNGRFVLNFNHDLQPMTNKLPNLPANSNLNANYGIPWRSGAILVSLSGKDHLFITLEKEREAWQVTSKLFPTNTGNAIDGRRFLSYGKRPLLHDRTVFASKMAILNDEKNYEVEVHPDFLATGRPGASGLILSAEVTDFPAFLNMLAVIYSVAQTPDGYVVEIISHIKPGGKNRRWHDHFNLNGGFIERVNMDGTRLLPVVNSREVFLIDDRNEYGGILKRIF